VNGGVYVFSKEIVSYLKPQCSLESDVIPLFVEAGRLRGMSSRGYFIDIGVPESYERSQTEIPAKLTRPAVFFDRDGVLNIDHGHVGTKERFEWQAGAREAVRAVNEAGYLAFVFTNQAGIGKGHYSEADFHVLMDFMQDELSVIGAHFDDIRYCPYHPEATLDEFRCESDWRKPSAGMLHDLMKNWDVYVKSSFVVGDKESDMLAATNAGLRGFLFQDGNLLDFLENETPLREDRT
jgi:D-glycero-D-manno-heptose 1,7-bisphosphate phosphatase